MTTRKKNPPKHLKAKGSHERMPARPNDRLENERLRQEARAEEAEQEIRHGEHSDHENVAETPDNTKLFYEKLLPQAKESHKKNQRFIRTGIIWLFALPIILFIIRNMTNGNKIAFLIIWIIGMFIIAAFLIIVAYQDEALQESLDELQEYVPEVEENQLGRLKLLYPPEELEWLEDIDHEYIRETLKQEHKMPPLETIMAGRETRTVVAVEPEVEVPAVEAAEAKAKSELIDKISEEFRQELEAMGPEKRKPDGGSWVTEDAELMWQHVNDQTFDNKGGTGDE